MKHIFFIISFVIVMPLYSHSMMCAQHLSSSANGISEFRTQNKIFNSYFKGQQSAKLIGLIAKDSTGKEHTALGPIIGSSHSWLLERLESSDYAGKPISIVEVLWAGEIHLKPKAQKLLVLEINETAGLNETLASGHLSQYIHSSKVENAIEVLSAHSLFEVSAITRVKKFRPNDSNLHILDYVSAKDFRHDMGNRFNVLSFVEMIGQGYKFNNFFTADKVELLRGNLIAIVDFIKVYQREVHIDMAVNYKTDLERLVSLEPVIEKVKTEADFFQLIENQPKLLQSLETAHDVFSGKLNFNSIINISDLAI